MELRLNSQTGSLHFGWYSLQVSQRVGGCVDLGGWLHTKMVCQSKEGHRSQS